MVWGSVVNAVIIDHGRYLTDTQSGLDWLDVTSTVNMTPDQVNAELIPGGNYYGWRYATDIDLLNLIVNFTDQNRPESGYFEHNMDKIDELIELLGDTLQTYWIHFFGVPYPGVVSQTIGFTRNTHDPRFFISMIVNGDDDPVSSFNRDYSIINFRVDNWPTGFYDVGSFLVRDSSINIPEPPPFILMTFFLLLLMIKTRHN